MHVRSQPPILHFGTPVVLTSTLNEDGTANLSPMSSAWWLGWRCMLGLDASAKTTENLKRTGQCVLNLPSADMVAQVDAIARTTARTRCPTRRSCAVTAPSAAIRDRRPERRRLRSRRPARRA